MKKALFVVKTGQDTSYLVELLLKKYEVYCSNRQTWLIMVERGK
jgi:GDP-D-mannose dehydratase